MTRLTFRPLALAMTLSALAGLRADDPPAVPVREVTKHSFAKSKVFPGTVRDYWVYVPKQYDPAKPACVWVNQDGVQFGAVALNRERTAAAGPGVFDRLIHEKAMPVAVGVFVRPGVVKA